MEIVRKPRQNNFLTKQFAIVSSTAFATGWFCGYKTRARLSQTLTKVTPRIILRIISFKN